MESWKNWFQPHILERGRDYFDEGRVSELERTEDGYTAIVEGTEEYEVEILLKGDSVEDMLCDCPYAEDGNACKHMAAVLFAIDAGETPLKKASAKKERLTPAGLVKKIPDSQLRPLLTELISADEKLYRALLLRYGETSLDECMKTLRKELASIGNQYADHHGYINYREADDFECDMADFIGRQTQTLLGRGEPLLALRAGMDALREFASYEVEEGCGYIDDAMDAMLTDILCVCKEDAFLERYTNYSDIRKLRIQQMLDCGKTDEAIRLLEEGKSAGHGKRGLVVEYSKWLMDLYERQGQRGTGMLKIKECYASCPCQPVAETSENAFKITLPNINYRAETASEESSLSEKEHQILKCISARQSVSRAEIETATGSSQSATIRALKRLLELGLIQKRGSGKKYKILSCVAAECGNSLTGGTDCQVQC